MTNSAAIPAAAPPKRIDASRKILSNTCFIYNFFHNKVPIKQLPAFAVHDRRQACSNKMVVSLANIAYNFASEKNFLGPNGASGSSDWERAFK